MSEQCFLVYAWIALCMHHLCNCTIWKLFTTYIIYWNHTLPCTIIHIVWPIIMMTMYCISPNSTQIHSSNMSATLQNSMCEAKSCSKALCYIRKILFIAKTFTNYIPCKPFYKSLNLAVAKASEKSRQIALYSLISCCMLHFYSLWSFMSGTNFSLLSDRDVERSGGHSLISPW